jgi:hypothetical protein
MEQHFVTYYSPGTFVAETSIRKIDSWDVDEAMRVARSIGERYNATPYGFRFSTRSRGDEDLDSKVTKESPMYYLGGKVETLAEVKRRATEKDRILVSNMEGNGYKRIITNDNSWRWTQPLNDDDIVLDYEVGKADPAVGQDAGTIAG